MSYDKRIIDIARIAAIAAGKNACVAPQLLSADIIFTLADAVSDGRIILGRDSDGSPEGEDAQAAEFTTARAEGIAPHSPGTSS